MDKKQFQSGYKQILKATSIFGGVQFLNILVAIGRSKVFAIFLGPSGMGVFGLYSSALQLVTNVVDMGVTTSGVRSVSKAVGENDNEEINLTLVTVNRLAWISGILGAILVFLFAAELSQWSFDSPGYSVGFQYLSVSVLFVQLSNSRLVILQGFRKLGALAKANVLGNVLGFVGSVPIIYFFGDDGVVGSMLLSGAITMAISFWFSRSDVTQWRGIDNTEFVVKSKQIIKLGVALSLSNLLVVLNTYLFRIFLVSSGGIEAVGLYSSGFSIVTTYVGLIFTAMATDFYPRLSSFREHHHFNESVNQQAEIALLIIGPLLIAFCVFMDQIIRLLFSIEFLPINTMLTWCLLGLLFKALSWPVGFIVLAKGNSKLFLLSELIANVYMLGLNILGYKLLGLSGIGVGFLIGYVMLTGQIAFIGSWWYQFRYNLNVFLIFLIMLTSLLMTMSLAFWLPVNIRLPVGMSVVIAVSCYSFIKINSVVPLIDVFRSRFNK